MPNSIGIDFGTTKTMVSYWNPATNRTELVRLGRDRDSIPTTVHVDESGAFLFGEDADDQIETDPEGYCRAFKLLLGERDPVLLRADETAESLAARFLRHVKEECEQSVFHGEAVTEATITIPVSFAPARKVALKHAAEAAGFTSVSFLPEPEAAGTAFLQDNPADKFARALVLDWGGGTLDIAIISRDEDGSIHADRHCAEGRDDVGGEEMDRELLEKLKVLWEQTFDVELLSSEENEPKHLRESEKVKIGLSRKDSVPFRQGKNKIDVTRDQFRQIVEQLLQASVDLVNSALSKNKAQGHSEPDAILLIGGTSQSPVVRETMEKNFPRLRVLSWHHSHEAVALGATPFPSADDLSVPRNNEPERRGEEAILTKFKKKYERLKSGVFPTIGEPKGFYRLPDDGWQMDCGDNPWNNAAITLRPGETEPREVHGAICSRWYAEGGAFNERKEPGRLGHPVSDEESYDQDGNPDDRISRFENGAIVWNNAPNETHVMMIPAAIAAKFQAKYEWLKTVQFPSIGKMIDGGYFQTSDGGWECHYDNYCVITLRPGEGEPRETHGAIEYRWFFQEGGVGGWLGHPVSDEEVYTGDGDTADRISHFECGDIVWKAKTNNTYVINIKDHTRREKFTIARKFQAKYDWLKREQYPSVGEPDATGIYRNPDGGWQCNYSNWCAIVLRPGETEAREVHGAICARWYQEGGAFNESGKRGNLGYPISDELQYTSMGRATDRIQYFERGEITWNSQTNECYVALKDHGCTEVANGRDFLQPARNVVSDAIIASSKSVVAAYSEIRRWLNNQ